MAKQTDLFLTKSFNAKNTTFTSADTTTAKVVFTPGSDDSELKMLVATTDDTTARDIRIILNDGTTDCVIGTANILALSANGAGVPGTDLLDTINIPGTPLDQAAKHYIPVKAGWTVKAAMLSTITAAKTVWICSVGEDL